MVWRCFVSGPPVCFVPRAPATEFVSPLSVASRLHRAVIPGPNEARASPESILGRGGALPENTGGIQVHRRNGGESSDTRSAAVGTAALPENTGGQQARRRKRSRGRAAKQCLGLASTHAVCAYGDTTCSAAPLLPRIGLTLAPIGGCSSMNRAHSINRQTSCQHILWRLGTDATDTPYPLSRRLTPGGGGRNPRRRRCRGPAGPRRRRSPARRGSAAR
jgi:hypothetical protein